MVGDNIMVTKANSFLNISSAEVPQRQSACPLFLLMIDFRGKK